MYGWTALPWIGPGRTSATWIVRSSRFSGPRPQQALHLRAALDLEVADRVGALDLVVDVAGRRAGSARGRSSRRWSRAIWSTQSSTAESIPSPSRSIFRKPASAQESLSHWQICRPSIAAGCTGTSSTSGRARDDHPARVLRDVARQAGDLARELAERAPARRPELRLAVGELSRSPPRRASGLPSVTRASRSSSANGRPSALPRSRIAPRER